MDEYIKKLKNRQKNAYNQAMDIRHQLEEDETLENAEDLREKFNRAMADYDKWEKDIEQHNRLREIDQRNFEYIEEKKSENPKTDPEKRDEVDRKLFEYGIRYGKDPAKYPKKAQDFVNKYIDVYNERESEFRANQQYVNKLAA